MQIVVSDEARQLIAERGGRVYVSVKTSRCCGRLQTLTTRSTVKDTADFRRVAAGDELELYLPRTLGRAPDELHLAVRRFPRRLEAYWDGCAWVT